MSTSISISRLGELMKKPVHGDHNGWTKTKKGRRVYDRPQRQFTEKDLLRIWKRLLVERTFFERIGIWESLTLEYFASQIVTAAALAATAAAVVAVIAKNADLLLEISKLLIPAPKE